MNYDLEYRDNLLRIHSKTAEEICKIRWDWVKDCEAKTILDYGCGVGWFRAFSPNGSQVDTYDIMPVIQTGITRDNYDLITFWDVLEHIVKLDDIEFFLKRVKYAAISIPIIPKNVFFNLKSWHHYKPGEHIHYFTERSIEQKFRSWGFGLVKKGTPECPPRKDVSNFLFKKEA